MNDNSRELIRVLVADDEDMIIDCYRLAFESNDADVSPSDLDDMEAELFGDMASAGVRAESFDFVSCQQGDQAVELARRSLEKGCPFDVIILDVSMPPGIDGVQTGKQIRAMDPNVIIIFVTGFSDIPSEEIAEQVPPRDRMRCLSKPVRFEHVAKLAAELAR